MFKFLGGIILFILLFLFFLLTLGVGLIKSVFYSGRNQSRRDYEEHSNPSTSSRTQRKVFDDNEGEYVDFEEID